MFLLDFIAELLELLKNGFKFNDRKFKINVHSFICDAPARAYIKCIKSHGGYSSCDKCMEIGEYYGRVIYPGIHAKRRTDISFLLQEDEEHHTGISPLLKLEIGMVSIFPVDYMHSVCLGVVRKLLYIWTGINRNTNVGVRLNSRLINLISDQLISVKSFITIEFNRKPRTLQELQRWKATEFRTFLLYVGVFVLKDILGIAVYKHFLLFHCAVTILLSEYHINALGVNFAEKMLNIFIEHSKKIYGIEFLVYNVHVLCHLVDDVKKYGPLDMISAFPFENYFAKVKSLVRSPHKPLEQIYRRLHELIHSDHDKNRSDQNVIHFIYNTNLQAV